MSERETETIRDLDYFRFGDKDEAAGGADASRDVLFGCHVRCRAALKTRPACH